MPAIVAAVGVSDAFAIFFGGTSLLILVGVALDTLAQIESYLLMRKYDGLVKSGKKSKVATAEESRSEQDINSSPIMVFKTNDEIELIRESSLLVCKTPG